MTANFGLLVFITVSPQRSQTVTKTESAKLFVKLKVMSIPDFCSALQHSLAPEVICIQQLQFSMPAPPVATNITCLLMIGLQ